MRNVVGICNLHDGPNLETLTNTRPLGTVTFLGRYGLMDFVLSNFSNSGIDRICVLVDKNVQAVRTHMGSGSIWVNNTITGFVRFFHNEKEVNSRHFNTDINNIRTNYATLDAIEADYVVVAPPFLLMNVDYREVVDEHIRSGADITIMYGRATHANKDMQNCEEMVFDKDNNLQSIIPFGGTKKVADISLQTFVFKRDVFIKMVSEAPTISSVYNIRQMVSYMFNHHLAKVNSYRFDGYVAPILSLEQYVNHSFNLLDVNYRKKLFKDNWPIYTTTHNTPPSLYGPNAKVENSFVANGSIIKGTVKNSIISREVVVEEGAVIEDCILFTKTTVGPNVHLKHVLADKSVKFVEKKKVSGTKDEILSIPTGAKI